MSVDANQTNTSVSNAPQKHIGFSSKGSSGAGNFKDAILEIFDKIGYIQSQLVDGSTSEITIEGVNYGEKTGLAANYAIPQALNKYENQASLMMDLIKSARDFDKSVSQLVS